MINKEGRRYVVRSKEGKSLGKYPSKKKAENRLRQVEYFKHRNQKRRVSNRGMY